MTTETHGAPATPEDETPEETAAMLIGLYGAAGASEKAIRLAQLIRRVGTAGDARYWTAVVARLSAARLRRAREAGP